ncbi:MAG: hypothetical protein BTN85_1365 [Candidatus Methanohalarchaeum thermophilum]|uniref:Uncharacterized protein n=1 Tax=Methanohalarchaeum thermophilum TaxID=1903181 RepID=A0A1Q6DX17_METT1|nr:MAG: hypothetical protein BTN85_1365 [Candidatus Methanohalarchaeum thermophilum]
MDGRLLLKARMKLYSGFRVGFESLKLVEGGRTGRNEFRLGAKASIRKSGSTAGGALDSGSLNTVLCISRRFLGIGEPAKRPVCGRMISSVTRNPDDTGEWMKPHEFIHGRTSESLSGSIVQSFFFKGFFELSFNSLIRLNSLQNLVINLLASIFDLT